MRPFITLLAVLAAVLPACAQEATLIWPEGTEGTEESPRMYSYIPENPNGTSVVVLPGGGYMGLAKDHEGVQVAEWLNKNGVAAFVLHYRHAPKFKHPVPRSDVRRAIQHVRAHAPEWGLDTNRIGVLGFSAGGHLAATAATQFVDGAPDAPDAEDHESSRPDFAVLVYPVISMKEGVTHGGSRKALLGENPDPALVEEMSLETQVTEKTPPIFIAYTTEDQAVSVKNGLLFYEACLDHNVPVEMHIFETGKHGLGLGVEDLPFKHWPNLCIEWMKLHGWVK